MVHFHCRVCDAHLKQINLGRSGSSGTELKWSQDNGPTCLEAIAPGGAPNNLFCDAKHDHLITWNLLKGRSKVNLEAMTKKWLPKSRKVKNPIRFRQARFPSNRDCLMVATGNGF